MDMTGFLIAFILLCIILFLLYEENVSVLAARRARRYLHRLPVGVVTFDNALLKAEYEMRVFYSHRKGNENIFMGEGEMVLSSPEAQADLAKFVPREDFVPTREQLNKAIGRYGTLLRPVPMKGVYEFNTQAEFLMYVHKLSPIY